MITVMGATGNTGRKITEQLLEAGEDVRALGRSPEKLAELEALGAETVAALADQVPMSRSAFAARFTQLVGEPAMSYVTRWRMHLAAAALRDEGATVAALADRFGYQSEAAFARAFKRVTGTPPGALRRAGPIESGMS